jgi:hypothetical protein
MIDKKRALFVNLMATLAYGIVATFWLFVSVMGIMSVANVDSFFHWIWGIYIFLLLWLPNLLVSQILSWFHFVKARYSKSYNWLLPPLIHAVLIVMVFVVWGILE